MSRKKLLRSMMENPLDKQPVHIMLQGKLSAQQANLVLNKLQATRQQTRTPKVNQRPTKTLKIHMVTTTMKIHMTVFSSLSKRLKRRYGKKNSMKMKSFKCRRY
jgi:hypothetical protein